MVKKDIIQALAYECGLRTDQAAMAFQTILNTIEDGLKGGQRIELRNFGVFKVVQRKKSFGRDIKKGKLIPLEPQKKVKFKAGKIL